MPKQSVVSSRARSRSPQSRRDHHPRSKSAQSRGSERSTDWSRPRSISTEGRRPRSTSRTRGDSRRAISRTRKIYDTPYDTKGRCHYHPQVQLAKKKLTGGWKVVFEKCPKCMEELYINNADKRGRLSSRSTIPTRNNGDGDDNRSTRSNKSSSGKKVVDANKVQTDFFADDKSVFSRLSIKSSTSKGIVGGGRKQQQQHNDVDDRSVFSRLSSVASVSRSVANKHKDGKSLMFTRRSSNGVSERQKYNNSDDRSVSSRNSRKSSSGDKMTTHSTKRYEYPFDAQGYCHMHPHIRLATKKLTGGWKINCDFCPECGNEDDDNRSMGSKNSRKSTSSRRSTKSSSSKKGRSKSSAGGKKSNPKNNINDDSDTVSELSSIQFKRNSPNIKNDQSTKSSKIEKDKEVSPKVSTSLKKGTSHGSSKVEWDKEVPKINSSLKKGTSIGSSVDKKQSMTPSLPSDSQRQNALLAYKQLYNSSARVVKNMIFEDIHGKLGRYTGEVNELKLPHGMGDVIYDNGLVKGGNWVSVYVIFLFFFMVAEFLSSIAASFGLLTRNYVSLITNNNGSLQTNGVLD